MNFLRLEGDLFVTFDYVEVMSFPTDGRKYLVSVFFRDCASFRKFHLVEGYYRAFTADFGLEKLVLGAEICWVSKIGNISDNFGANSRNFSDTNLQMFLQK